MISHIWCNLDATLNASNFYPFFLSFTTHIASSKYNSDARWVINYAYVNDIIYISIFVTGSMLNNLCSLAD